MLGIAVSAAGVELGLIATVEVEADVSGVVVEQAAKAPVAIEIIATRLKL
jgi:hypothetical protein